LKLATLLLFGALLSPALLLSMAPGDYAFVAASLLLARPLGLLLSLLGSGLHWRLRLAAAWFGPKGFASLIYAILVLHAGVPEADRLYHIAALVIVASIIAHTSTDVPMARRLVRGDMEEVRADVRGT
jgi:NhaP-type Na+/H+ or K+/H+ antiporter